MADYQLIKEGTALKVQPFGSDLVAPLASIAEDAADTAVAAADDAESSADGAAIAAAAVGVFDSTADGLAATTDGQSFYVSDGGAVTLYRNDSGSAVESAGLATQANIQDLASPDTNKGADLVGYDRNNTYDDNTAGWAINIGDKAVMRPASVGIFSSSSDQRLALLDMISKAANEGKTIEWGPIDVSLDVATGGTARGLVVPSGSRWVMHPDTRIRALPNAADNYEVINIRDVSDVTIEGCGARIIGERDAHTGVTGEFGMGVSLKGCSNITIRDLHTEDCWGDGWYIGSTSLQEYCQNILLENISSLRARRNGLSLISARGFTCIDGKFIDTNGTAPQAGVDIEPNDIAEYLENINFVRALLEGNESYGFDIFLGRIAGTSNPVDIRLIDCVERNTVADAGFIIASVLDDVPGRIELIRPKSFNAGTTGIQLRRKTVAGARVVIDRPYIENWNRSGSGVAASQAAIAVFSPSTDDGTEALGGVDIINPDIRYTSGTVTSAIYARDFRSGADDLTDLNAIAPNNIADLPCVYVGGEVSMTDPNRASVQTLPDANATLGTANYYTHNIVPTLTADRIYDISTNFPVGTELEFELTSSAFRARFRFNASETLWPVNYGAGRVYESQTKGSRLKIRKVSTTEWFAEQSGTWSAT